MTDTALSAKIDTLVNSGKCMGLTMLKGTARQQLAHALRQMADNLKLCSLAVPLTRCGLP